MEIASKIMVAVQAVIEELYGVQVPSKMVQLQETRPRQRLRR